MPISMPGPLGYRWDRVEPIEPQTVARLSMREVGRRWVAYLASPGTMDDAVELGSIPLSTVLADVDCRRSFLRTMKAKALQTVEETGRRVEWGSGRSAKQ